MCYFDSTYFDATYFDVCTTPAATGGRGGRGRQFVRRILRRPPPDDEDALLMTRIL